MAAHPTVHAGFGTPARQNRWKVGFRIVLAIPLLLVGLVYAVGAFVIVVIGWFAALVMGRLPRFAARYLSAFVVFGARLSAYSNLMLDRYPPFSLFYPAAYPVNVEIEGGPVRRLAVLFRIFLLIPANIVNSLVTEGLGVVAFFIWLIVLVAGRMPTTIFGAVAAVIRFQARTYAYALMLTGKYPGELFGDQALSGAPGWPPVAPPGGFAGPATPPPAYLPNVPARDPSGTEGPEAPSSGGLPTLPTPEEPPPAPAPLAPPPFATYTPGAPSSTGPQPPPPPYGSPSAVPPPYGADPYAPGAPVGAGGPTVGRLVLSKGSKRLLVLFIVLGVLGYFVGIPVERGALSHQSTINALNDAADQLQSQIGAAQSLESSCGAELQCQTTYQSQVADAFAAFGTTIRTISFPSSVTNEVNALEQDTDRLVAALRQDAASTSLDQLQAQQPTLQNLGTQWDDDAGALQASLSS